MNRFQFFSLRESYLYYRILYYIIKVFLAYYRLSIRMTLVVLFWKINAFLKCVCVLEKLLFGGGILSLLLW